jgi:hypothetical protein
MTSLGIRLLEVLGLLERVRRLSALAEMRQFANKISEIGQATKCRSLPLG